MTDINFEAVDASSLTPKQRTVLTSLKRGKSPGDIAEKMKITPAGVYGHIRAIRAAADHGKGADGNGNAVKALMPEKGGYEEAVQVLDSSFENETLELKKAEEQLQGLEKQIKRVSELRDVRQSRVTALQAARESLDSKLVAA